MTTAARLTSVLGFVLILIGVGFYFGTGMQSWTAMIPGLFFGLPLLICGLASRTPKATKIAMHVAVVVAGLGVVGGARVFGNWAEMNTAVRISHLLLLGICAVLVVVYVRSFIAARRSSAASEA